MSNPIRTEKIRKRIPNNKWIKRQLANLRISLLNRNTIPRDQVKKIKEDKSHLGDVVRRWEKNHPKQALKLEGEINAILAKNPDIKNTEDWEAYLIDLKYSYYAFGFLPFEYVCYGFKDKSPTERNAFVSDLERVDMIYRMNDFVDVGLFMDKGRTYDMFRDYYHRECVTIEKDSDFEAFKRFIDLHPVFVKKQAFESVGRSVALIDIASDPHSEEDIFKDLVKAGKHILEERIIQSPELSAFNNSSVNTVRCITVKTKQGVFISNTFLKAGRKGSFVDNGGAGGILIGIDTETGITATSGVDEFTRRYQKHPDNGLTLQGIQMPDWQQMKNMCIEMAHRVDTVRLIGWDLAHTTQYGWVVVEGNGGSQFVGPQSTFVLGIRNQIEMFMNQMDLYR